MLRPICLAILGSASLSAADITSDLLIHLTFDETSGSVAADSANSYDATLSASASFTTGGKIGGALENSDLTEVPAASIAASADFNLTTFTAAAWVQAPDTLSALRAFRREAGSKDRQLLWYVSDTFGQGAYWSVGDTKGNATQAGSTALLDGAWHHLAMTVAYDGSGTTVTAYVDGSQWATANASGAVDVDSTWPIDLCLASGSAGPSLIDEFRLYSRALSTDDITALYNYAGGGEETLTLNALAVSHESVLLNWNDVTGETGYEIYRSIGADPLALVDTVAADVTSYTDDGLLASTQYNYEVRAVE